MMTLLYYHYCWTWPNILRILEVTSFQYLYNISKKNLGMEFIFSIQINITVFTSWGYCVWWKWPDMPKVPKIGSWWHFCNILGKECRNCFCFLFWGVQSCLLLLVSLNSQTVESFCLNTAIQWLNSNYVGRSCHLWYLCSKLMFFKRSRV